MRIFYFTHATSTDNEAGRKSGWLDPSLSGVGKLQAADLRKKFTDMRFDLVFSSDLRRAMETASLAFPAGKIIPEERLREMKYGELNGCPESEFPPVLEKIADPYPSGENCKDVEDRIRAFLSDRREIFNKQRVAVISHQFPQLALEVICNGLGWRQAILQDWRNNGVWQPGWLYEIRPSGKGNVQTRAWSE